jgi:hypothetical protein
MPELFLGTTFEGAAMKKPKTGKERIMPPSARAGTSGSKAARKGSPAGARVLADLSVAKRQGVKRKP